MNTLKIANVKLLGSLGEHLLDERNAGLHVAEEVFAAVVESQHALVPSGSIDAARRSQRIHADTGVFTCKKTQTILHTRSHSNGMCA